MVQLRQLHWVFHWVFPSFESFRVGISRNAVLLGRIFFAFKDNLNDGEATVDRAISATIMSLLSYLLVSQASHYQWFPPVHNLIRLTGELVVRIPDQSP